MLAHRQPHMLPAVPLRSIYPPMICASEEGGFDAIETGGEIEGADPGKVRVINKL
jgi:hypothetical protein